ncbi:6683_t:CDS:2 [Acaulospora colombiana]|uniref:6683_t:CDS:1 n=1 Tax=Acaulospora colombiana TaxID=27376 RepID=A0ACA9Q6P6_9GLOM|nr:6683_t:CDS:2 [Acaulospora colombiana]
MRFYWTGYFNMAQRWGDIEARSLQEHMDSLELKCSQQKYGQLSETMMASEHWRPYKSRTYLG